MNNHLQELSLVFLGSGVSLIISAIFRESTAKRYGIGGLMLFSAILIACFA